MYPAHVVDQYTLVIATSCPSRSSTLYTFLAIPALFSNRTNTSNQLPSKISINDYHITEQIVTVMAPATHSQPTENVDSDAIDKGSQDTGTKRNRKITVHSDGKAHIPTETVGTSSKKKGHGKKKMLVFEVKQAQDHANIFEGRVQENIKDADLDNEKDGLYFLNDMDHEYEQFTIPDMMDREINMDNGLGLSTKNLANDGFIPLMGFQSNSAFNSLWNSPVTRKELLPTNKPWRKGETCLANNARSDTETLMQARSAIPPVKNNNLNPTPSTSKPDKPIVVSSDDKGNESKDSKARRLVRKLLNNEKQVRTEVLSDLGTMAPAEVTVAKAFAHGQAKKVFE